MVQVGIEKIGFYTSQYYLNLNRLAEVREVNSNKYYSGLGQEKMSVSPPDEDVVTLAANASFRVLKGVELNGEVYCLNNKSSKTLNIRASILEENFKNIISLKPQSLYRLYGKEIHPLKTVSQKFDGLPVLFWEIVAATIFMLTRWEETTVKERDEHGRFPAKKSVAYKQGFLDRPKIDEYAVILREWLKLLMPSLKTKPSSFEILLSHDIDVVCSVQDIGLLIRDFGRFLIKDRSLKNAYETLLRCFFIIINPSNDISIKAIREIAKISKKYNMSSEFYFMAAPRSSYDYGYNVASKTLRKLVDQLWNMGFAIGIHSSYKTYNYANYLIKEKNIIEKTFGIKIKGGRQHYLRFEVPITWRNWEKAGLSYDSTLGYSEHDGYRCGTCHPFKAYDLEMNRILEITEIPLIVMDATLKTYRGLTPQQGKERIMTLAEKCKAVEGTFTLLWHNNLYSAKWKEWGIIYEEVISELAKL